MSHYPCYRPRRSANYVGQPFDHPHEQIDSCDLLHPGDHAVFRRDLYSHHGIVTDTNYVDSEIKLTHFQRPQNGIVGLGALVTEWKSFDELEAPGDLYRVVYGEREALKPGAVVRNALQLQREFTNMGQNVTQDYRYNLFTNNCEHFAFYCKTGVHKSVQVQNFASTAANVGATAGIELTKIALMKTIIQNGTLTVPLQTGGGVATSLVEVGFTAYDIYRLNEMLRKGTINDTEFENLVAQRVCVAIGSASGAIIGSYGGFYFGGPFGMLIGGILGNIAGKLVGYGAGQGLIVGKDIVLRLIEHYQSNPHPHNA